MTTVVGALAPSDIKAFLVAGLDLPTSGADAVGFSFDGDIPTAPNRLYTISGPYGGTGLNTNERGYDNLAMQIRSRGRQGGGDAGKASAADDARLLAWQADALLLNAAVPLAIGTQHVNLITRSGGPPTFLLREPSGRVTFVCNYLLNTARF